jgi:hypothetical protein
MCCWELEQNLGRIVILPECCREDCKQPRHCCNWYQHNGSLYLSHWQIWANGGRSWNRLQAKVWLTPARTRQAFQAWPNLGINSCVCVLCSVLCVVSLSYLLFILALQYLCGTSYLRSAGYSKTGTLILLQPTRRVFHSTTIQPSSRVTISSYKVIIIIRLFTPSRRHPDHVPRHRELSVTNKEERE